MIHINLRHWPFLEWKHETLTNKAIGWISLAAMVLCASTYNTFAKNLTSALSPLSLVFLSEILTAFFVLFSFGALPTIRGLCRLPRRMWAPLLALGMLNGIAAPLLWFMGLHWTSAVNASLFGHTQMLFLLGLAVFILRERLSRAHLLSATVVTCGVAFIALRGFSEGLRFYPGDFLILLSCLTFACGDIVFRKYLSNVQPHIALLVRSSISIAGFFLASPFIQHPLVLELRSFPVSLIPILLAFAFISRFLNASCFYEALERLPVTTVSFASNMTFLGSIAFAHFFLGEPLTAYHIAGTLFILAGMVILEVVGVHPTEKHLEMHLQQTRPHRA